MNFDQRRKSRIRYTTKTTLSWSGGRIHGFSLDISSTGIFVETATLLPLETDVIVRFEVESNGTMREVVARGQVARTVSSIDSDPGGTFLGMGVVFNTLEQGELSLRSMVSDGTPLDQRQGPPVVAGGEAQNPADLRAAPRVTVGIPVWWGIDDPPQFKGRLANVSATGALIIMAGEVQPIGSRVFLCFNLPVEGRVVEVRGIARVVRAAPMPTGEVHGMGMEFEAATMDVSTLAHFIQGRLEEASEVAELEEARDDSWSVDLGQLRAPFLIKASAALFSGMLAIQLLIKVLHAFT